MYTECNSTTIASVTHEIFVMEKALGRMREDLSITEQERKKIVAKAQRFQAYLYLVRLDMTFGVKQGLA